MSGNSVPPELDAITDRVLSFRPRESVSTPRRASPKSWSLSVEKIFADGGLRLDAARFDPDLDKCMASLEALGLPLHPLHELADLSLPNRFVRVHVDDERHGLPYLNATDLLSLFAIGLPAQQRFLSRQSDVDLQKPHHPAELDPDDVLRHDRAGVPCSEEAGRMGGNA